MPHQDDHGGGGGWQHYRPSSLVSSPAMAVTQPQPDFLPNSDDLLYTAAIPSDDIIVAEPPNGVTLLFRGVSVATKYNAVVETVCRQQSSVHVRQATGFFMRGHVHGIVALNESSAVALADALSGRRDTCEGQIWADGVPVLAQVFRESVGVVKLLSWAFPEFSVESNLSFAGRMRREGVDLSHRVELLCKLFHLPPSVKVLDLTPSYRRRLDAAMELMASPPILVVHNPLHGLDTHSVTELVAALDHAAEALGTTVVLTLPSLELSVYDRLESLVILGDDGHTVYSGRRADMASYFVHRVMHPLHRHATRNNNSDVPPNDSLPLLRGTDEETRASALVARHTLSLAVRRVSTLDGASGGGGGGGAVEPECGSVQGSAPDLDGGEGAMDYVHLWAAAKVTDRYAAAFFDSAHRSALDTRIDTALAESRAFSNSVWMRHPLQPPNALKKFCMLAFANIRQRVVTLDFYVGWFALSVWITGCVLLEHYQETTQQGLFNTRGILFFMIAITLQLNQTFLPAYSHDVDRFLHLRESGVVPTPVQLAVIVMVMCLQRLVYLLPVAVGTAIALNKDASVTISLLGVISWAHITLVFLAVLIFRDRRISTIVIALYDAYQLFFSGFLVNTATQPESGFASGSLARYVYGSCVHHYLVTTNYTCDGNDWTSYCYTSQGYLELEGFQNDDTHHAVAVMAWVGGLATFTAFVRMWLM